MAKKVVLIVLGALALLCGVCGIVGGAVGTGVTGSDNTLDSGAHHLGTPTPALVSGTGQITDTATGASLGATTIRVTANSQGAPVFLGIAPAAALDTYLTGVAYDEVTNFEVN